MYAAGIGCYLDSGATITINSGTVRGIGGTGAGAGIGCGGQEHHINITINGGTVMGTSCATGYPGIGGYANVTINGGTVTGTSTDGYGIGVGTVKSATVTINGGNIIGTVSTSKGSVTPAKNAKGDLVYKTTFSTGISAVTDVSKALTIRDKNGTAYGMDYATRGKTMGGIFEAEFGTAQDYSAPSQRLGAGFFWKA